LTVPITDTIAQGFNGFSKGHRKVARFILDHRDTAAFMTLEELAEAAGVSKSTAERFARHLGFPGYPEFRAELGSFLRHALEPVEKLRAALGEPKSPAEVLQVALTEDLGNLQATLGGLSPQAFERTVGLLRGAARVFLVGLGSSAALVSFASYRLSLFHPNVEAITGGGGRMYRRLLWLTPRDVVLALSFPRYSREVVEGLRYSRERGAKVVALTDSLGSPLVPLADEVLLARAQRSTLTNSFTAPLAVLDALVVALAREVEGSLETMTELTEHVLEYYQEGVGQEGVGQEGADDVAPDPTESRKRGGHEAD